MRAGDLAWLVVAFAAISVGCGSSTQRSTSPSAETATVEVPRAEGNDDQQEADAPASEAAEIEESVRVQLVPRPCSPNARGNERVRVSHILVAHAEADRVPAGTTRSWDEAVARSQELLRRVAAGVDFATLAQAESDGPSATSGGDLGCFGRGQMVKLFENLAFLLEPGEVDIVETRFGFHVVLRTG